MTHGSLSADGVCRSQALRRPPRLARAVRLGTTSGLLICATAVLLLPIGVATLFRARRVYTAVACLANRVILRLYGVRVVVRGPAFPRNQTVYVSNHTSTLDLFILMSLGLPNTRFFLSGYYRRLVPLATIAWMMGTFFTVPQDRPRQRTRIFQRAERVLRRTGESVYLSPEGRRVTTGGIGHFNKGAFHLAANLKAPIVPMYFDIPPDVDPVLGYDARPGIVNVHVLPAINTKDWQLAELPEHVAHVRSVFVSANEVFRCA